MKSHALLSLLFLASPLIYGQAVPAGVATVSTGPDLSAFDGIFHYSLNASQLVEFGYSGGTTASAVLSGNIAYSSKSQLKPFSMTFSGGVVLPEGGDQGGVSTFQNVTLSQGLVTKQWIFNVSDSFSFLPESPTTGISGIAGLGDIGTVPLPEPSTGLAGGILTYSGDRYSNTVSGVAERSIGKATSISGSGSWGILRFLDSDAGLDSDIYSGSVAVNRKIDARSSASVGASYTSIDYGSGDIYDAPSTEVKGISVSYERALSRSMTVSGSIGPQWVSSSNSALVPSSVSVAGSAGLSYVKRYTTASVGYSRGVTPGSGVIPGAETDSVHGSIGRPYGRNWLVTASGAYTHSAGLGEVAVSSTELAIFKQSFNTVFGGVQVSHSFSEHFSGYASYFAQDQTTNISIPGQNAFSGVGQTIGVGVTFTPRSTRLGQF